MAVEPTTTNALRWLYEAYRLPVASSWRSMTMLKPAVAPPLLVDDSGDASDALHPLPRDLPAASPAKGRQRPPCRSA
jgi:hypothetical protein